MTGWKERFWNTATAARAVLMVLGVLYTMVPGYFGLLDPWTKDEMTMASGRPEQVTVNCIVQAVELVCRSRFTLKIAPAVFETLSFFGRNRELERAVAQSQPVRLWYDFYKCQNRVCSVLGMESQGRVLRQFRSTSTLDLAVSLFCLIGAAACFFFAQEAGVHYRRNKRRQHLRAVE